LSQVAREHGYVLAAIVGRECRYRGRCGPKGTTPGQPAHRHALAPAAGSRRWRRNRSAQPGVAARTA
nr:hypothetical protein [Tanacetum cinerariifolium]